MSDLHETIKRCSFDAWYNVFRRKTVRSKLVNMSDEFRKYLLEEDFLIESGRFPELKAEIEDAIEELGGKAFVKLNFTAPIDAQWIGVDKTLTVTNFEEVVCLLKASTRVLIDLTAPFGEQVKVAQPVIVLKKWFAYWINQEFRVFVKEPELYAITSRYCDVKCELALDKVNGLLKPFIEEVAKEFGRNRVIFDLYISPKLRVHIVDIQPWNVTASTGMFTPAELEDLNQCETRLCETPILKPLDDPAVPIEMYDGQTLEQLIESFKQFQAENP